MNSGRLVLGTLPACVVRTLQSFEAGFDVRLHLSVPPSEPGAAAEVIYASPEAPTEGLTDYSAPVVPSHGGTLELQVFAADCEVANRVSAVLAPVLADALELSTEIDFFTYELSERFEEINLLYSISETLGTTIDLLAGARKILKEVRDVMGAKRGALWVHGQDDALHVVAEVGEDGRASPIHPHDPDAITAMVFREGRSVIATRGVTTAEPISGKGGGDSFLSVPIRYSPGSGESRTVGVINLIGRQDGSRFNAANQKLISAIASQVGAAIENNRLVRETLSRERMVREMELAHDLQMKLLPDPARFPAASAAGRVQPTEQVGGDFYQLFQLPGGRVGVMVGDVSLHGFPSALIMTLAMSAAGIYARESESPAQVLRGLDDALSEELETTEMFLTTCYAVIDPAASTLVYSNAGHPHAFVVRADGSYERLGATDPPVGFAGPDSYSEKSCGWDSEGDLLFLFTDGLGDVLTSAEAGDGERQVLDTVVRHRFESPDEIIEAVFALERSEERALIGDDRTALVVRL